MVKILLLQLFWFSFIIIGHFELSLLPKKYKPYPKIHWLFSAVFAFATGFASLAFVVVPGIILSWPILIPKLLYVLVLAVSLIDLVHNYRSRAKKPTIMRQYFTPPLWFIVPIIIVLGGTYAYMLRSGSELEGDTKFELAQITLFAEKHLTLTDPIFGQEGVPQSAYSMSTQHVAQATVASLLHESAAWVWFYSAAFFQLLLWISLFVLSWEFLPKDYKRSWSYALLAVLPIYYGNTFIVPELHNRVVYVWIVLFTLGIKLWVEKKQLTLLYVSALLAASTHPLNSVVAALFFGIFLVILLCLKKVALKSLYPLIGVFVILVLPMVMYFYFPHGITAAGFNDNGAAEARLMIQKVGPLYFNRAHIPLNIGGVLVSLTLGLYIYFSKYIGRQGLRLITIVLAWVGLFLALPPYALSMIGYSFLYFKAPTKTHKLLILLLVLFSVLFIYNPVILTVFHSVLPQWAIGRFQGFNMLVFIAPIIGIFCLVLLPLEYAGLKNFQTPVLVVTTLVTIVTLPLFAPQIRPLNVLRPNDTYRHELQFYNTIEKLSPSLKGQLVLSDDQDSLSFLPAVIQTNVFSISNESNTNPAVHIDQRKKCIKTIVDQPSLQLLASTKATRLLITPYSTPAFKSAINNLTSLNRQQAGSGYEVYAINNTGAQDRALGLCTISSSNIH